MKHERKKINLIWHVLRLTNAYLFILVGADKFFNLMVNWQQYINPAILALMPITSLTFIQLFGLVQIMAGSLLLTRFIAAGIAAEFLILLAIFFNLITMPNQFVVTVHAIFLMILLFSFFQIHKLVLDFD